MSGLPARQGLYDPDFEHDACGLGFVAQVGGAPAHAIVRQGLELLVNLSHRGAAGCDPCSGDGAGILIQIPHAVLARDLAALALPAAGGYGVAMLFLPNDDAARARCERAVAAAAAAAGHPVLAWRDVPCDDRELGEVARRDRPVVRQAVLDGRGLDAEPLERRLYVVRRQVERELAAAAAADPALAGFYVASLSARTVVYKGMLTPEQLPGFYQDLADPLCASALALVHSRFSTNTFPTWARAHPYRMVCHNGEINTLKGNVNWMRVREGTMRSPVLGDDLERLYPIVGEGQSDSASLDNVLEFLVRGGRSLPHAMMMLIPEAWEGDAEMDAERRGFYAYHAAMMEPWDGPAAVAFTDGRVIGATLDRNGLRPGRWVLTTDDRLILASEAGALEVPPEQVVTKGRLQPGKMLLVDLEAGHVLGDDEVKRAVATRQPYAAWAAASAVAVGDLPEPLSVPQLDRAALRERQAAFGYTAEELRMVVAPMASSGDEPVGSMGNDTPLAVLSDEPQLLFKYFRQLFAQVTNPPIDPIREQLVMSLAMNVGPRANLLVEGPQPAERVRVSGPVLGNADRARIAAVSDGRVRTKTLRMLWPAAGGAGALEAAVDALCADAARAVRDGYTLVLLSDRGVSAEAAPIPSLLATAAVHHHLIRAGLRTEVGLMVETGEAREVAHFALLLGYGAGTVNPYLAFETVAHMARDGELPNETDEAVAGAKYVKAVEKGLLKILSKMGISTAQSYCGAQLFEAVGLGPRLVARYFPGTPSRVGGVELVEVAEETLRRHRRAFAPDAPVRDLPAGGEYHYRIQGEHHEWNPGTIAALQRAAWDNSPARYAEFARLADEGAGRATTLRGLLEFAEREPVPPDEVEPAAAIVRRFVTGAMSFGSLSSEAHETLAVAMNRIGGRSNSGEGGEDPGRYGTERNSAIKQIASARFGVTAHYLVNARELQIKMAQGAKPGEGGQLPGAKVDEGIARTRFATPGVTLISPPPHHDIYSIEDLAQLIFDLRNVNPRAAVSVKLVSEVGVGTIAAGVAKAGADLILIAGDAGGTGASPLSSVKHAGVPWELGLADAHQTLVLNDLRGRVRLQTDGQLKTGRDVVIAALLGAEEFGFATAPLIVEGCVMMRKCHLNTCPVGIATQDPVLRAKFKGQPEHVVNYFFLVAEEARAIMARLGFRTVDEMVGRTDALRQGDASHRWKARTVDLSALLWRPSAPAATRCTTGQAHDLSPVLDQRLLVAAEPALARGEPVRAAFRVRNVDRATGAMLSGEVARRHGRDGLPDDTIHLTLAGSAGQSFGAFCAPGVTLELEGEANDYVGKGLSGGRLVVYPPAAARFDPGETMVIGNVALYGATAGEAFFRGRAGERFAVRNSGATAVVEGVGDHGCEYMTGGTVVVIGETGRNFAAGMSGGVAYVLDEGGTLERRCNRALVELGPVAELADRALLRHLLERHAGLTGSARARRLVDEWELVLSRFVRVMPVEYRRVLEERARRAATAGADAPLPAAVHPAPHVTPRAAHAAVAAQSPRAHAAP